MSNKNMVVGLLLSCGSVALCAVGTGEAQDDRLLAVAAQVPVVVVEAAGELHLALDDGQVAPRLPHVTRDDALMASRACAHESTFRGGRGGTFDCGAQIQVIQTRRGEHETFTHALLRTMPRFAAHTTDRSWVHALPAGPISGDIPGWPYAYPARHDSDAWHSVYQRVSDFMLGREALPCAQPPEQWFGRRVDHEALQARLDSGRWMEADCNPGGAHETQTLNAYLTRVRIARRDVSLDEATR